ncbi:MAG: CDP-alcohol phosphatidyltransferase family protein [Acidobacteria bacterium]|nr:CDP-alcohol phosphatidyltransferase family protein [Acidobacteriota bacterium]MDA1236846.1 CDP-alcohol phosphatidyltransferase family protein [Acidobacteriota bacterium]
MREASKTSAVDAPRQRVSRGMLKVANSLTMLRLVATPALVYILLNTARFPHYDWYALALIAVLQATDVLDGYLARQAKGGVRIRTMGEVLDPIADKLYINSAVIALTWVGRIPEWAGGLIVLRDALILAGWLATYLGTGVRLLPNKLGKVADTFQAALLVLVLLRPPQTLLTAAIWVTVSLTIASGFLYLKGALSARHEARL